MVTKCDLCTCCHTSLSVGEYAGVVSLKRIVQNVTTQGVENDILTRKTVHSRIQGIKAVIESESLRLVPTKHPLKITVVYKVDKIRISIGMNYNGLRMSRFFRNSW